MTDGRISHHYDADHLTERQENRRALQSRLAIGFDPEFGAWP